MANHQRGRRGRHTSFLRRNVWVLVTALFLLLILVVTALSWTNQSRRLSDQDETIQTLKSDLAKTKRDNADTIRANLLEGVGFSKQRLDDDAQLIESLLETAFTWDSGKSYASARKEVKERFDLSEKGSFLTDFMPPSRFNEDEDGKRFYYIDTIGMNSSMGDDPQIDVLRVRAGDYDYVVSADMAVTSDDVSKNESSSEQVSSHRSILLFVTVDSDGRITDLSGTAADGHTRHSA